MGLELMPQRILVLHGPNLNLLEGERSLTTIDARLEARATALGVEVKTFQSNWEGALLDFLAAERNWFDAVIVNPASLAPAAVALAEALSLLKKPAIEVLLDSAKTGRSALKSVVQKQIYGKGPGGYLEALDALAPKGAAARAGKAQAPAPPATNPKLRDTAPMRGVPSKPIDEVRATKTIGPASQPRMQPQRPQVPKTIGPSARAADPSRDITRPGKTIGPRKVQGVPDPRSTPVGRRTTSGELHIGLTREDVRRRIAERLSGRLSPSGLATWARQQWQSIQRGAPCETGQRDKLEDVLQTLLLSTASKASDEQLIDLMTQLG